MVSSPPMPEPTITPDLREFSSFTSNPESKKASWAAIKPKVITHLFFFAL